jgi:peroxiredoxin Q/BCP
MLKPLKLKLSEGMRAPAFEAPDAFGKIVTLESFRGQPVVLYFYPRDDTPGCTKQACGFRDAFESIRAAGAVVIGVSIDSPKKHAKFIKKYQLPFLLVSDEQRKIVNAYGVWGEKQFMGRKYEGTHRVTFLIDRNGIIQKIWPKVKPENHAEEVLVAVKGL